MPRDVFYESPDGKVVLQAWVSFTGRDEDSIPYEELHIVLTEDQAREYEKAFREGVKHDGERDVPRGSDAEGRGGASLDDPHRAPAAGSA